MPILFDFHSKDRIQPVTVHTDDDATFNELRRCQDREVPADQVVRIKDCTPDGGDRGEFNFRAGRIRNVRWA